MTRDLLDDALAISGRWLDELDLARLVREHVARAGLSDVALDVVAVGKASREMAAALDDGEFDVRRRVIVCDEASLARGGAASDVVVGEHPVPGAGSLEAGRRVRSFLDQGEAACTLFLISGGASSLCVAPAAPLDLADVHGLWDAAVARGVDVTTLNQLRAATSAISGGEVLRHVASPSSRSLILVDNVVSGARWVASGFTYDFAPTAAEMNALLERVDLLDTPLGARLAEAAERRRRDRAAPTTRHVNDVVAEPALMHERVVAEARRRGYRVVDLGARVQGDASDVARAFVEALGDDGGEARCVVGVGELTVRTSGEGRGGRCQEFAWRLAPALARRRGSALALGRASDGRDFLPGVGGAWSDERTLDRAHVEGFEWARVADEHDTFEPLRQLEQLLEGTHTGWNLCDVYLVLCEATASVFAREVR